MVISRSSPCHCLRLQREGKKSEVRSEKRRLTTQLDSSQPQNSFQLQKNRNWLLASISKNKLWAGFTSVGLVFFFSHTPARTHIHSSNHRVYPCLTPSGSMYFCHDHGHAPPTTKLFTCLLYTLARAYFCFPSTWELGVHVEYSECQKKCSIGLGGLGWVWFCPWRQYWAILEQGT